MLPTGLLYLALAFAPAATPAPTAATGPLAEGNGGFFCKTSRGTKRLFRREAFYFCGTSAKLPARVTYAVAHDAPLSIETALQRFGAVLRQDTGVAIEHSSHPDVLLVATPNEFPADPAARRQAIDAMLAKSGISLQPKYVEATLDQMGLDQTSDSPSSSMSLRFPSGDRNLTVVSFHPGANLDAVVKSAFTTYLDITAPMTRPEQIATTPGGISMRFTLRGWLDP